MRTTTTPASHRVRVTAHPQDAVFEVALVPSAREHQDRAEDALRLLAVWAVRAVQSRQVANVTLDSSRPTSDECTPVQVQEGA
jgi:hypothetical protein